VVLLKGTRSLHETGPSVEMCYRTLFAAIVGAFPLGSALEGGAIRPRNDATEAKAAEVCAGRPKKTSRARAVAGRLDLGKGLLRARNRILRPELHRLLGSVARKRAAISPG
jgi:hypothetical protein